MDPNACRHCCCLPPIASSCSAKGPCQKQCGDGGGMCCPVAHILRECVALCHFHQEFSAAMTNTVYFKQGKLRHRQDARLEVCVVEGKEK